MRATHADKQVIDETVGAVNGLTTRWAETVASGTVLSAAGVWPLLAFLADGASGTARDQLAEAVGLPADRAAHTARTFLVALDELRGVDAALGLWTSRKLKARAEWLAGLPPHAHRNLTGWLRSDRKALDRWAAERTRGLVKQMPVALRRDTELVLASALVMETEWIRPFAAGYACPRSGPWEDRELAGLHRTTSLLDRVGVADTPAGHVTDLRVVGTAGMDVHLLLGDETMPPGQVLKAGVGILAGRHHVVPGGRLPYGTAGPGVTVHEARHFRPTPPKLHVNTVAFDIFGEHDLTSHAGLFGLSAATDRSAGHFPGISDRPTAIGSARQAATAAFTEKGFKSAAVTAMALMAGSARLPEEKYVTTEVYATFDRPFGFLAVHRLSGLVLAAGWVTEPQPYREEGING
ncbi:serpin family protein [Streptomyces sclerotialus]|uniref:serpin family protein n=1 Tax=Streptomyces sclerotialus TaxID=1957 RepID=UPI0034A0D487